MDRLCVTGLSGRIGRMLAPRLGDRFALVSVGRSRPDPPPVAFRRADVRDPDSLRGVFDDADAVVHLAALVHAGVGEEALRRTNVEGTLHVLNETVRAGVRRLVFTSSLAVYGAYVPDLESYLRSTGEHPLTLEKKRAFLDALPFPCPADPYGLSKLCGEGLCAAYAQSHALGVACIRVGDVHVDAPPANNPVALLSWCHRDTLHDLLLEALERTKTPGFTTTYAVSTNP